MANTSERREITRRVNAKEAETIQESKELVAKTKRFSAIAGSKNLAGRNHDLNGPPRAPKSMPWGTVDGGSRSITTVDDRILARVQKSGAIRDGRIIPRGASDKPQVGGMQFACGYLSPYFVTDPERMEVAFENVYILIHEKKISSKKELLPLLEQITKSGKPLLIIAEDIGGEALATLVVSKLRGPLQVAAVRAPGFGDQRKSMLQDIALLTGGKAITEGLDIQLENIQISDLGQAKKITIDKNNTVLEGRVKYDQLSFKPGPCIH